MVAYLYLSHSKVYNDVCELIRMFFDAERIEAVDSAFCVQNGLFICCVVKEAPSAWQAVTDVFVDGKKKAQYTYTFNGNNNDALTQKRDLKAAVKICVYHALKKHTHKSLPWGSLTGVRPTKLLRDMEDRVGKAATKQALLGANGVRPVKYRLAKSIVSRQMPIIKSITAQSAVIYIGIPFCPSVCAYCSFVSKRLKPGDSIQHRYMDALLREIESAEQTIAKRSIRAVYIGGGTPTSLDTSVLARLLAAVAPLAKGIEFTLEAGRPDTIDEETLDLLMRYGVNRISINPQTFKQQTLDAIGRQHTVDAFYTAYNLAMAKGFNHINIDLIFGLPSESLKDMKRSLNAAIKLNPSSITVHTLAIKKASTLKRDAKYSANAHLMQRAVHWACWRCQGQGWQPYYMYRQKYMKGNLENVGYAKANSACVYNIDMMEEVCSVLAFGAGAISKTVFSSQNRHQRIANPKDIETYITHIDELIDKKKKHFL